MDYRGIIFRSCSTCTLIYFGSWFCLISAIARHWGRFGKLSLGNYSNFRKYYPWTGHKAGVRNRSFGQEQHSQGLDIPLCLSFVTLLPSASSIFPKSGHHESQASSSPYLACLRPIELIGKLLGPSNIRSATSSLISPSVLPYH